MRTLVENIERPIALFFMAGMLALLAFLGWALWRDNRLSKSFDKIVVGTTQKNVVQLMGEPQRVRSECLTPDLSRYRKGSG